MQVIPRTQFIVFSSDAGGQLFLGHAVQNQQARNASGFPSSRVRASHIRAYVEGDVGANNAGYRRWGGPVIFGTSPISTSPIFFKIYPLASDLDVLGEDECSLVPLCQIGIYRSIATITPVSNWTT